MSKILIFILLASFSIQVIAQVKDTMYLQLSTEVLEKVLVEKVDSIIFNKTEDSLYMYQREIYFGEEMQIVNKRSLDDIDSIYFLNPITEGITPAEFQSYVLNGRDEVNEFSPGMDSVMNLTITGVDVTKAEMQGLLFKIKKVKGVFTLDNTSVGGGEISFFQKVQFDSSIVIKNNPNFDNINSFKYNITGVINGDLILENNAKIDFVWGSANPSSEAGFQQVTGINGDLILRDCAKFGGNGRGFINLKYVGGDLVIDNAADGSSGRTLYNFHLMPIDSIGGDLVISNNNKLNSLGGLEDLRYVGGDITITNNGNTGTGISLNETTVEGYPGFCWVKDAKEAGVIKADAIISLSGKDGNIIVESSLSGCIP